MNHQDIVKAINKAGDDFSDFEKELLTGIYSQIEKSLETRGGKIVGIEGSAGGAITKAIRDFTKTEVYKTTISDFLKNVGKISDDKLSVYKDQGFNIPKTDITQTQRIVISEYLDALNEDGLNSRFNQALRTLIYDNIRLGVSQNELEKTLRQSIVSGKEPSELGKYIKQTSVQAADAYSKVIDNQVFIKYKNRITGFNIIGSLIETSSEQCKEAVEKYDRYLTINEMRELLKKYEGKTIKGTTVDNVAARGLHFACRHSIVPVIK